MQRLEESVGVALLEASGRGRTLTEAGNRLVSHARRILAANNEAWLSITGAAADGRIGLGVTQDFADTVLPSLLNLFARSHPRIRIDLRVGRTLELSEQLRDGQVDIVIAMRQASTADEFAVFVEPMCWLWSRDGLVGPSDVIPLALLDAPCGFRDAALQAVDKLGRPYRLAATSPSLSGLRAAVRAGLAITVRTARWTCAEIIDVPAHLQLPELPKAEFSITTRRACDGAVLRLAGVLADGLIGER
jgi:DNA-binding transcriptional LysR family regulator